MKKTFVSLALALSVVTAYADETSDAFIKLGFKQTNKGVNNTVFAVFEKDAPFGWCTGFIAHLATNLGRAPTNIVETTSLRVVRFGPIDWGSLLITCSGSDSHMSLMQSHNEE